MWVGFNCRPCFGQDSFGWIAVVLAAALLAGCSSGRDERAKAADADREAASAEASSDGQGDDVFAAFDAWAKDSTSSENGSGTPGVGTADTAGNSSPGSLDGVIEQFNRKVSKCWKQPFGMPRLATVRLLVQFNPDGTVRNVAPRPEPSEAPRYRTETPYLVMIAQTSQALRECQPYEGIRRNYSELSRLEMVVDPRMFQK